MRYLKPFVPAAVCVAAFVLTLSAMNTSICYAQRGGGGGGRGGGGGANHGGGEGRGGGGRGGGGGSQQGGGFQRGGGGGSHFGGGGGGNPGGGNPGGGRGGSSFQGGGGHHGSGGNAGGGRGSVYIPGINGSSSYRGSYNSSRSPNFGRYGSTSPFGNGSNYYGYGSTSPFGYGSNYYGGYGSSRYGNYYGNYGSGFGLSIVAPLLRYGSLFSSQPYYYGYGGGGSNYGTYYGNSGPSVAATQTYRVPTTTSGPIIPTTSAAAASYEAQAERAFREHRYEDAAKYSNHAIVEDGQNGRLYLFASQTLFALGDYQGAAAAIHQAAGLLDRDEWGYVVKNYTQFYRGRDYVTQMEQLVDFQEKNPDAAYTYFLRGYHYTFLGHEDAARKQLTKALELEGRDQLAAELLVMAGGEVPAALKPETAPPQALTPPIKEELP